MSNKFNINTTRYCTSLMAVTQTVYTMWTKLSHKFNEWMGPHLTAPTLPRDVVFNTELLTCTCFPIYALNYPKTNILEKLPILSIILVHYLYRWLIRASYELVKPFFNAYFTLPLFSWWHYVEIYSKLLQPLSLRKMQFYGWRSHWRVHIFRARLFMFTWHWPTLSKSRIRTQRA
jgi:hypothetical protein